VVCVCVCVFVCVCVCVVCVWCVFVCVCVCGVCVCVCLGSYSEKRPAASEGLQICTLRRDRHGRARQEFQLAACCKQAIT